MRASIQTAKTRTTAGRTLSSPKPRTAPHAGSLPAPSAQRTNPLGFSLANIPIVPQEQAGRPSSNEPTRKEPNHTGLPDALKERIERSSGLPLDSVNVQYNSPRPARFHALAYTQGTSIYVGPRQEKHLPHEAWHVVQHLQGRVTPTSRANGTAMNDDQQLEHEAETMGKQVPTTQPPPQSLPPSLHSTGTGQVSIQRVEDPGNEIRNTIRKAYAQLRKKYGETYSLPTPSRLHGKMVQIIESAKSKKGAFTAFRDYLVDTYFSVSADREKLRTIIGEAFSSVEEEEQKQSAKRKKELEELSASRKKRATEAAKAKEEEKDDEADEDEADEEEARTFTPKEKRTIKSKLEKPGIQKKLYRGSILAYEKHQGKADASIPGFTGLNALTTDYSDPLSTSDLAQALSNYTPGKEGEDALLLEKSEKAPKYQVTMARTGGQEVHQLGPYLPSGGKKKSVQEIIAELQTETGLNSQQVGQAIDIKDVPTLLKKFPVLSTKPKALEKIRASRVLLAVEKNRGPEVAFATSLEQRKVRLGYGHVADYPKDTPLGPVSATANLKKARATQLKSEGKDTGFPDDVSYIPKETQERAMKSTTTFIHSFLEKPHNDPEAMELIEAILAEKEEDGDPSKQLVEALDNVLRTPEQNFSDDE